MTRGFCKRNNGPCAVCGLQNSNEKFRKLTLEALTKVQNSPTVSLLTVQLQVDATFKKSADKDLSYKGAKRICLREEVYHDLLDNTHNLEVLEQRVKDLELELGEYITKLKESSTNEPVRFSQFFGDQVARMTNILYQHQKGGNLPIFDPIKFVALIESRDINLRGFFDILFQSMNPTQKNHATKQMLKQKVMMLCYQMAALRNKQVSGTKTAIGLLMVGSGTSKNGINTLANMGMSSTYQTSNSLLIGCIDDYHNLHGTRIPSVTSISQISHMATILFNNVKITPIPYISSSNTSIHNPNGVDASILKITLWENYMISFAMSYNSLKTHWAQFQDITTANESSLLESLIVHSYDADLFERYGRKFTEIKLVDLIELNLKNTKDYLQAIKSFIELPEIQTYLNNYVIPIPADFPGQLYIRKAIVKKLESDNSSIPREITHLLPFLGPLHLSLNTRESVFLVFWGFFDLMYRRVFGMKKKLAAKPKPWRINLLLYLAHAGWQLIRKYVKERFKLSKAVGYLTFLDLLDNLIPSSLDIYATLFRGNHFEEYISTAFRLWTVMRRFNRHNYDKILLAFLSDIHYWKQTQHPIIDTLKNSLNKFDEYAVENFHSLLRRHTNAKVSTADSLRRDALFLDHFRHDNLFNTSFAPKRDYPYKKKDLDNLVKKTALFLLDFFDGIWQNNGQIEKKMEVPPSINKFCDHVNCANFTDEHGEVLICGHAYHEECFQKLGLRCHHCYSYLATSIDELTQLYNNRLHMDEDINNEFDIKNEKQSEDCEFDNAETINIHKTIDIELSEKILAFAENRIQIPPMQQPLYDISNCYQQSGSLHNVEENLLARFVSTEIDNTQSYYIGYCIVIPVLYGLLYRLLHN
ncbi:hypothetical protein RhiirA1_454002 [Rhizophagus irregularis]|uniref:Uncharacterized protein n=1 Tax=Rhizophagus irregularis TaxID=588596 RepID=A0A2N0S668_9GLOM|nr:hypothetical protein RhiirA1_454002 [Rhizophagus irregularis]